ncbi:hypothetical protein ABJ384_04895 [Acinetobacter sp. A1-4-2]|uniref:Mannuronan 5-epimerase n=1 Tax=Acinetobacter sp. A1-4-2 TaxID=3156489 RepID=A0AAU7SZY9_9GAMM
MANLEVQPGWPAVRQLENEELAWGGVNGNMNEQAKALAARTELLKSEKASNKKVIRDNETIYDYGAIGDGIFHTVEEWYTAASNYYNPKYNGLADVQADYPFVTDKDFSIDQAAILKLANKRASTGGGSVDLSIGEFVIKPVNDGPCLKMPGKVTLAGRGDDTILHEITPIDDQPTTSVWWDLVQFSGTETVGGGVKDLTVKHTGGRRNNTASLATRGGATRQKYRNINFESTIGSSIVIEGLVSSPKPTFCKVHGITSKPTSRHSVYISGATNNDIRGNTIYLSALEGIAQRGTAQNNIDDNDFIGVEGVRIHAVVLAQPPSGSAYKYRGLRLKGNRGHNLFGAGFYGQGNGCELYDSDVSGNDWDLAVTDPLVTDHHMMFYRTYRTKISNNTCRGGRNRGIMFYGCAKNDVHSNTVYNVIGSGTASVGAIGLFSYKDIDNVTYYSTDNKLIGNNIIDDRSTPLMKIGVQMGAGCIRNLVSKTEFEGIQTKIDSADGLSNQYVGETLNKLLFSLPSMTTGTNTSTDMSFAGGNLLSYVNREVFIKSFRLAVQQLTISGTATARLYKNGSLLMANVFTADNLSKTRIIHYQPGQYLLNPGDTINLKIETESLTSGQSSLSFAVEIELAQ